MDRAIGRRGWANPNLAAKLEIKSMAHTHDNWRVVCQDPGDGSGDVIVELPSELLEQFGWTLGDELTIETVEEGSSLRLKKRAADASS